MKILTTRQASELWNVSPRRITRLCEEGRIKDAAKVGGIWIMPVDTKKPSDARIKSGKYIKKNVL
ncbi:MAG: helix-turn-helix domain-containing protein [Bacillota bacterium]|nr:helix-turn-helix domain-containing protein [Bacillota bacterium]